MRKTLLLAGMAAALAAAACGGDQLDIGIFAVDGRWAGTVRLPVTATEDPADSARYDVLLDLEQSERDVSGDGTISTGGESLDIDVRGRWAYPDVDMVFSAPEFVSVAFDAAFATRDTLRGTVTGSGFTGAPLVIIRQSAVAP
jgi:hypothetical protein